MTQITTDILLNGMQLEIHPSKLTKCGEVHINDDCTNAFLFCAFCSDEDDPNTKFFRNLPEFIEHIKWHRSDDLQYLQSPSSPAKNTMKELFEVIEEDSRSNVSAPRHETDDISDWIAPPEELFELNTISNFIEIYPTDGNEVKNEVIPPSVDETATNTVDTREADVMQMPTTMTEEEPPEITGEVFIDLLDLFKKCPCVWHAKTAAKTCPDIIEAVYKLLEVHYNKCSQQSRSLEYVRGIVTQITDCFLDEYKDVEYSMNDSLDCLPWYFPYLSFLLDNDSNELDKSVFTDFLCPICTQELTSQDTLWEHMLDAHIEVKKDNLVRKKEEDVKEEINSWGLYPKEILEKFIEVYRSQTRLWDKSNDEYYSRPLRRQSYDMLLNILRQHDPQATRTEVVNKINKLRTQFANDRQKILSSKNSNTYVSRSWFYNKLKFLVGNMTKKPKYKPPPLKARPANFKTKVKNAKCPICTTTFSDHSAWLSHMQSAHTSDDYQSEDGLFYCTICGWQNKTKELLMRHLRNRHTHNMQKCTDCNMGFRLLSMLVEHRAKVHEDYLPFKCEICSDGFATRSRLRTHSMTHWSSDDLPHKCENCGAKFADRNTYNVHIRRHKVETKLRCEICEKSLTSAAEMHLHTRTHLDECPHVCKSCGKAFHNASLLTAHLNEVHGGVTYPCSKCEKEFRTEKSLADHFKGHQSFHNCDICGTKFFRKTSLRKHKRLKHDRISYDYSL